MKRIPVKSSMMSSVGFRKNVLEIEFKSGSVYQYEKVPKEVHRAMMKSESVGAFFSREIRPKFRGVEVTELEESAAA